MKPPLKAGSPDDFQTPPEAIYPLLPFLKRHWTIWECAAGQGNLVKAFEKEGYAVIRTDILTGYDFLTYEPQIHYDVIITNPPYRHKQQFLERAYALHKPFAMLLPLTTLETSRRQELFKQYGINIILFDKRLNFTTPSGKTGKESKSWFSTAWFTWGLGLPEQLNFVKFGSKGRYTNIRRLSEF